MCGVIIYLINMWTVFFSLSTSCLAIFPTLNVTFRWSIFFSSIYYHFEVAKGWLYVIDIMLFLLLAVLFKLVGGNPAELLKNLYPVTLDTREILCRISTEPFEGPNTIQTHFLCLCQEIVNYFSTFWHFTAKNDLFLCENNQKKNWNWNDCYVSWQENWSAMN